MQAEGTEFLWNGKGDEEVRDVEEFGFLPDGPELLVAGSALGTVAVVAAVVGVVSLAAGGVGALVEVATEFGGAAREGVPHGPIVDAGKLAAMSRGKGMPVLTQDLCEGERHDARCRSVRVRAGSGGRRGPVLR